jgi:vitamin B12 transporter
MTVAYGDVNSGESAAGGSVLYEAEIWRNLELELLLNYAHRQINFRDRGKYKYSWTGEITKEIGNARRPASGEIRGEPIDDVTYENLLLGRLGVISRFHGQHTGRLYVTPQLTTRRRRSHLTTEANHGEVNSALELVAGLELEQSWLDGRLSNIVLGKYYYFEPTSQAWVDIEGLAGYLDVSTRDHSAWGAGDSLRYKFTDSLLAKVSYEYALRLPNSDELFGDGVFIETNPELKPERSHNFNVGPRLELNQTAIGDVVVDVNGFWRETKDQIVLIVTERFAPYRNVADARSRGVEGSVSWLSPGQWLTLDGSITWMESINNSKEGPMAPFEGMPIPSRPYRFASWGARLHAGDWPKAEDGWDVFYMGRYVNGFYRGWNIGMPQFKMSVPDQVSHALGVTFATRLLDTGRYNATFEVDNVTDATLFDVWGVQRPGRSFNFKMFGQL